MARYKIWNKVDSIITPIGESLTAEDWKERYGWAKSPNVKAVIGGTAINGSVMMEFESMKDHYKRLGCSFTEGMTDEEVLAAIELFEDTPPEAPITVEDRAMAAQEFQLMETIDAFEVDPDTIEKYFLKGLWTQRMVDRAMVIGGLTQERRDEIVAKKLYT